LLLFALTKLVSLTVALDVSGVYTQLDQQLEAAPGEHQPDSTNVLVTQNGFMISAECYCDWKEATGGVLGGRIITNMRFFHGEYNENGTVTVDGDGNVVNITWSNGAVWVTHTMPTPAPPTPTPAPPTPAPPPASKLKLLPLGDR
jgi:hypothetical protein